MCETTIGVCVSLAQSRKYYSDISASTIIITIIMFAREPTKSDVCKEPLENFTTRANRR